jgi:transposase InsO family protein
MNVSKDILFRPLQLKRLTLANRFVRSATYEEVYLHDYENMWRAEEHLGRYFAFYNEDRPHQSLDWKTPTEVYWGDERQRAVHLKQLGNCPARWE